MNNDYKKANYIAHCLYYLLLEQDNDARCIAC